MSWPTATVIITLALCLTVVLVVSIWRSTP